MIKVPLWFLSCLFCFCFLFTFLTLGFSCAILEDALKAEAERFRSLAYAPSTCRTFRSQRQAYLDFCAVMGYTPVPASTQTLTRYAALLARTHKYTSIKQYLNIVRVLHLEWELPNPLQNNYQLSSVLKGIRRSLGDSVNRKEPINPKLLLLILGHLDLKNSKHSAVWCACLLMFFGMLRRSNVMPSSFSQFDASKHLRRRDVQFTRDSIVLTIRWSKTIQFQQRVLKLPLVRIPGHPLCPLQATFHLFQRTQYAHPEGPALVYKSGTQQCTPLTTKVFLETIKSALQAGGLDSRPYGGHSFRRGGASWAYQVGLPVDTIKTIGDWKSNAYEKYIMHSPESLQQAMLQLSSSVVPTYQQ